MKYENLPIYKDSIENGKLRIENGKLRIFCGGVGFE
jgi:hypothetical protein